MRLSGALALKFRIRNDNMKRNTIKWRIFKYNLIVIITLITLVAIIFNIAVRMYIERDILEQLSKIASRTEHTALQQGRDFLPRPGQIPPPPDDQNDNGLFRYYFMLDRSLREPLSVLNADYILLDKDKNRITLFPEGFFTPSAEFLDRMTDEIKKLQNLNSETYLNFYLSGTEYIAVVKPVYQKNSFGLGWIIIYSSLQKVNQLQWVINLILLAILILSALITALISSQVSKKISSPFSSLNQHIKAIAERNFGTKIHMPVDDELQELVNNINIMSDKLETYDKAQKTFLQNVSHELRTPLMSIQSYAEGIKYGVVDSDTAVEVIIDETKRLTHMIEDLLYLSRLDTIEENYHFNNLDLNDLIKSCIERMNGIAIKNNIKIIDNIADEKIEVYADEEKLSRAITNVISNCIRYAKSSVTISKITEKNNVKIIIEDDGPGFDADELPNIFERFYMGKKGNFGLGLAISKNVIQKHGGKITAKNSETGAMFIIELLINS